MNKIILLGNLSRDIELKYTQSSLAIATTGIATNRKFKTASGEQKQEVMFVDLTFFGRSAEIANQYLRKGSKVLIEGRLVLDQWTDNATGQKRSKHQVNVESMQMLDGKESNAETTVKQPQQNNQPAQQYNHDVPVVHENMPHQYKQPQQQQIPMVDIDEDEIPF